jgi:hypothetical protein
MSPLPLLREPSLTHLLPQWFHQVHSPAVCRSSSPDRVPGLATALETPRHCRTLHQRQEEDDLRQESGASAGVEEGGTATRGERREAEADDEAGDEQQPQCQRNMVTLPRRGTEGIDSEGLPGGINCTI